MSESIEKDTTVVKRKGKRRRRGVFKSSTYGLVERVLQYTPKDNVFHSAFEISKLVRSDFRSVGHVFQLIKLIRDFPYEIEFTSASTRKHLLIKIGKRKLDEMEQVKLLLDKANKILKSSEGEEFA